MYVITISEKGYKFEGKWRWENEQLRKKREGGILCFNCHLKIKNKLK